MSTPLLDRRRLMMAKRGGGEHPLPSWCTPTDYAEWSAFLRSIPGGGYSTYPPQLAGGLTYFKARWTASWIGFVCSGCLSLVYWGYGTSSTTLKFLFNGVQWGNDIILPYRLRSGDYYGTGKCIQDFEYDGTYLYVKGYLVESGGTLSVLTNQTILMPPAPNVVNSYVSLFGGYDPAYPERTPGTIMHNTLRYYNLEIHTNGGSFKLVPCTAPYNQSYVNAIFDAYGNVVWRATQNSTAPISPP